MASRPQFSVITPVLNGERTIATTIGSVAAQTGVTWEHFVVDNGSDDGTEKIVKASADGRLRYYRIEERNRSLARNLGIEMARGQYLLFLDADDWLLPGALETHARILDADPSCGISITDGWFCTDSGKHLARFSERRPFRCREYEFSDLVESSGTIGAPVCAAIRAKVILDGGIRFPEDLSIGEDWLFFVQLGSLTEFRISETVTCMYRWHPSNTSLGSGAGERRRQLATVRQRIAAEPFFASLSPATRRQFFYEFLFTEHSEEFEKQLGVMSSAAFIALPPANRAGLMRLVASDALLSGVPAPQVIQLIRQCVQLHPRSFKSWIMLFLVSIRPALAKWLIRGSRTLTPHPGSDPIASGSAMSPVTGAS